MLELKQVTYRYPGTQTGIEPLNLSVKSGNLLAVLGQSGSGKTTLLNLIAGFLSANEGQILLSGQDVTALTPAQRGLGIVFQHYALFPHMSVLDNIAYPLKLRNINREERRAKARDMAERVGLLAHIDKYPKSISGGQQQRVALARALIFEPKALLLDEPLSALDAGLRMSMREEIREIQQQFDITTILITHDQEEAMTMADEVAVLQAGKLLQIDAPRVLYEKPNSQAVASFIGRANFLPATVVSNQQIETQIGIINVDTSGFNSGDKVIAMIRPEYLQTHTSAQPINENCFAANYQELLFCGAISQAKLQINNEILHIEGQLPNAITHITIPPQKIHLLTHP